MPAETPLLRAMAPDDPAVQAVLGSAAGRFRRMVAEAEAKARPFYRRTLGREAGIAEVVEEVFAAVEAEGDAAVVRYSRAFDGSTLAPEALRVPPAALTAAWEATAPALRDAMRTAIGEVEAYQRRLVPAGFGVDLDAPLGARFLPYERVGAYVPGGAQGSLPLFSSVIMNLVPARVAGVRELVLVTPPRPDGTIAPELMAAAHAVGVHEVYRVGGVPAIAALACGTATIRAVEKIVGPGNIVVTLAKKQAYGRCDIDMLAGPSEILVLADRAADPAFVAADLLSQAEHDVLAMAACLCIGPGVSAPIAAAVERQLAQLPEARRAVAAESLRRFGLLIEVADLDAAVALANRIAPEHCEILVADPRPLAARIRTAGALFVGPWSPEAIGDYVAGPSHTLPTGGTARMWSGIGADTFLRRSSIINLDEAGFRRLAQAGLALARGEGLEAHARSIAVRLEHGG